jgi:hypothetical protein
MIDAMVAIVAVRREGRPAVNHLVTSTSQLTCLCDAGVGYGCKERVSPIKRVPLVDLRNGKIKACRPCLRKCLAELRK